MRKLKPLEWTFIGFGTLLATASAVAFFFEAERLGIYFGYLVETQQNTLGKLEYSVSDTLRKNLNAQNFVNLNHQQKVFDRDTIMTNEGSEAVLSMTDGGSIDVGPNSLIELVARDGELILDVKKGTVTGLAGNSKIKIRKDGKIQPLPAPKKESLLTDVMTKNKAEVSRSCKMTVVDLENPRVTANGEVELGLVPECDDLFTGNARFSLVDPKGKEVLHTQTVPFDSGKGKKVPFKFAMPGTYRVKWDSVYYPDSLFQVQSEWSGFVIPDSKVQCGGKLAWQKQAVLRDAPFNHFFMEMEGQKTEYPVDTSPAIVSSFLPSFPARVRMKTESKPEHFFWTSPYVTLDRAPMCNELISPKNEEHVKLKQSISPVVFTWKQQVGQGQVKVEVSPEYEFKAILKTEVTAHNFVRMTLPTSGKYYWRVTDVKSGDHSPVLSFYLVKPQ